MTEQPNKPGGAFDKDCEARDVTDQQSVKNQSAVAPEDYPEPAGAPLDKRERDATSQKRP